MPKIIIDPADNLLYKSFYINALERKYGKDNVVYSRLPFVGLDNNDTRGMAFVVKEGLVEKNYYIHANDSYKIIEPFYEWCDIYGHVNANWALTDRYFHQKLVPLCPSFATRCWSLSDTICHFLKNTKDSGMSIRKSLGQHYHMFVRCRYEDYLKPVQVENGFVFFLSTLWYNDQWNQNDIGVNYTRSLFVKACKSIECVHFYGGLVPQSGNRSSVNLFKDCIFEKEIRASDWLDLTKKSMVAFNTPAFLKCHGWKIGEYLAMGKAIVSTPLYNDLPAPLVHGQDVHYVGNDIESMTDAVCYIASHSDYRCSLERGAMAYWEKYGSPEATLRLLNL